jgi:uncharacterized protein YjbJ (UPF0337 family)
VQAARVEPKARTGQGQAREVIGEASDLTTPEREGFEETAPRLKGRHVSALWDI